MTTPLDIPQQEPQRKSQQEPQEQPQPQPEPKEKSQEQPKKSPKQKQQQEPRKETQKEIQRQIQQAYTWDETECVSHIKQLIRLDSNQRQQATQFATQLITEARRLKPHRDSLDALLEEFDLSTTEGTVLMCLAESLLRIPDTATADDLIEEKLLQGNWQSHLSHSDSIFVNASTWGLMLGEKWLHLEARLKQNQSHEWLGKLVGKLGEPVLRRILLQAMKVMAEQYILGHDIQSSLKRSHDIYPANTLFSFDALGEGARTLEDANDHQQAYEALIDFMSDHDHADEVRISHGISIKLSAIHPRYQWRKHTRIMNELLPRFLQLCYQAREANVGLTIDAEEAERLDISLELFAVAARDPTLKNWDGLGFVVQAYQKRATHVIRWLTAFGNERNTPINVRLVKGAYWDREIKYAQQLGLVDYPVFTRKANTDLNYLACAQLMFDAGPDCIYPQFATHNGATIALIETIATHSQYEFQRLHGMGDLIYQAFANKSAHTTATRVYAPLGSHKDLLPYLARRLLENGANSSFINRFLDEHEPINSLAQDPLTQIESMQGSRNPGIPLPSHLYLDRPNSAGENLEHPNALAHMQQALERTLASFPVNFASIIGGMVVVEPSRQVISINPANTSQVIGYFTPAEDADVDHALALATQAYLSWDRLTGGKRALYLTAVAETLQKNKTELMSLITLEAGRAVIDAEAEIREAIDFCHYYALQSRKKFSEAKILVGPTGEKNQVSLHGRGVFLCISPWNFPAAIFVGQIAAALAAGNTVIAKPAEQTSLTAFRIISLMHDAGIPKDVLHLVLGDGPTLGAILLKDKRVGGVAFTGSTLTASRIAQALAARPGSIIPFIAETGGINCMIADSSALLEQLVDDVIQSAFMSAGQRCSSLRVLYLQEEIADEFLRLLCGACDQIEMGNPDQLSSDIGPIIDAEALEGITQYLQQPEIKRRIIYRHSSPPPSGFFIGPHILLVDNLTEVQQEVFGPVLHIVRFQREKIDDVIQQINACDYALTLGIQSRIEQWANSIYEQTHIGNTYINRHMVGAVVGVQPFGGSKLSGTGPKAGGPNYLLRFATEKTKSINTVATGGNAALFNLRDQ